jgi:hypothetical protein
MYHFETTDPKTKKVLIFEDKDFKTILKTVLQHENDKFKNDDESDVIIEDSVGNILQTVSEKYLKHILGIQSIRKTAKLEKSTETFNNLKINEVATVSFKNKCHSGIITIWEKDDEESIDNSDNDLDNELEQAILEGTESESDIESVHMKVSNEILLENKKLIEENTRLKEQIKILKSFVTKYRDLSLKINDEVKVIKFT